MTLKHINTIEDVMAAFNLSRDFIKKAILSGELKCFKHGSGKNTVYRISRHDLNAWYQSKGGTSLFNGGDPEPGPPETDSGSQGDTNDSSTG